MFQNKELNIPCLYHNIISEDLTCLVSQAKRPKARNIGDPPLKQFPMAFFDGAAVDSKGGAGVCIWINEQNFIEMKLGCG